MIKSAFLVLLSAGTLALTSCTRHQPNPASGDPQAVVAVVAVAPVARRDLIQTLRLQAEFRPYQEVEVHAKVSGYLRSIGVDFGDRVKAGQELATLEVPELDSDLAHAVATAKRAAAEYDDVHLESSRIAEVGRSNPHLLAEQDLDAAKSKEEMAEANLAAAKAEADKYRTMVSYTKITAPFDGVITARYADPGALIQGGTSSAQSGLLLRVSENDRLRLDFPVSVTYAGSVEVGDPVDITLEGSGGRLTGHIARFTHRISMETRTMETEVEVPNAELKLIPGMYATATIQVARRPAALSVPIEAVSGGHPPTVYLVGKNRRIEERPVKLGMETPTDYEVLAGLNEGDLVMTSSRAGVRPGQVVEAKSNPAPDTP